MKNNPSRRDFLHTTLAGAAGLGISTSSPWVKEHPGNSMERPGLPSENVTRGGTAAPANASWMREGIVAASAMESLTFILRRGGEAADAKKRWHAERSEQAILQLKKIGVNLLITNLQKGFGLRAEAEDIAATKKFTELAHRHGLKVIGYVGGTMMYETLFREEPEARHWMQVDEFGHPVYYTNEQTFRYAACRNTPGYREFIERVISVGLQEVMLDGIHFDQMMWWPEPRSCREVNCREQFRAFLRERYSDATRARLRFGFSDFDEIIPPAYDLEAPPVRFPDLPDPLMQEWARFRAMSLAERCGEFGEAIHKLNPNAAMIYNPSWDLTENAGFIYGVDCQQLFKHGEGVWTEEGNLPEWTADDRLVSRIRSYKIARSMGQTLFVWQRLSGPYPAYQRTPFVLRLAESLAYNDANLGVLAGADAGGSSLSAVAESYVTFFQSHLKDLLHTVPIADIAVLRSFSSIQFNPAESNFSTLLFEQTLIQSKLPFGIIFDRQLQDLRKYKCLVLADQDALSGEQLDSIRKFVENGGGLVATGSTSLLTEWRTRREKFGLADLFGIDSPPESAQPNQPLKRRRGKGRVVYFPRIDAATPPPPIEMSSEISNQLWRLPWNYAELAAAVRWAAGEPLSANVDAPLWVTMELADQPASNTRLLHLVNFKVDEPLQDIAVRVRIPWGFRLRDIVMETPHGPERQALTALVQEGTASFRVPRLEIYALILLSMEEK